MLDFINYIRNKVDKEYLKLHYMRIGRTQPIIEKLNAITAELNIEYTQYEVASFKQYHFSPSYENYCGAIVNLEIDDENLQNIRRDFWENFIWKTEDFPIPVAILIPNSNSYGSLTIAQTYEVFSFIRLTDRPFKIFEHSDNVSSEIWEWLYSVSSIVHRKNFKPKEE